MPAPHFEYRASVKQFTETEIIDVLAWEHPGIGNLVNLVQSAGSLSLHFSMTCTQARELAAHLVEACRVLEGEE